MTRPMLDHDTLKSVFDELAEQALTNNPMLKRLRMKILVDEQRGEMTCLVDAPDGEIVDVQIDGPPERVEGGREYIVRFGLSW